MADLVDIAVTPLAPTVVNGANVQLTAIGLYDDDTQADITTSVVWASATPAHATVGESTGLVTGVATGTSVITATSGAIVGAQTVTSGAGALVSIAVTASAYTDIKGDTEQFTATGTYEDDSTADLTATATWASDDEDVATVVAGLATAVEVGLCTLTATSGAIEGWHAYAVHNALVSIDVTPNAPTKHKGETQQMTATGTYEDASTANLTASATWASATPAAVTVSATGLATAVALGTAVVGATSGAIEGHETVTVDAAALVSIAVTPASPAIVNGETEQLTAIGTYTDGTTADLTATATWASATEGAATVDEDGLVTAVANGTSVVGATVGVVEGHTTVTATQGDLVSLAITPDPATVVVGGTVQLTATGTYEDASTADLTTSVAWVSAVPAIVTVGAATGLVTGVTGGSGLDPAAVTISCSLTGVSDTSTVQCYRRRDSYARVDVQSLAAYTVQSLGINAGSQALVNLAAFAVAFSWDGINQDGELGAAGSATAVVSFSSHTRNKVYLKRVTGTGGGAAYVDVYASEEG